MTGTAAGSPANIQIAAGNLSKGIWSCNPDYTGQAAPSNTWVTTTSTSAAGSRCSRGL